MPSLDDLVAQHNPAKQLSLDEALAQQEAPQSGGWQDSGYGFKVKPVDLGGGKQSVQREDGAAWFGPQQGNTGKPGWFDANGNRVGDAPGKGPSLNDRAINHMMQKERSVSQLPVLGQVVPAQLSGAAKGLVDVVAAPAQLVSHAFGSNALDRPIDDIQRYYEGNWQTSKGGEMLGQAVPFIATMGGSAAAQAPQALTKTQAVRQALASIAKAGATGAVAAPAMTPETGVQSEGDYWGRKGVEAAVGGAIGTALPVAGKVINRLSQEGQSLSPEAVQTWFKSRVAGKPSDVLQADLQAQYAAARARGSAPFQALRASGETIPMDSYVAGIDKTIAEVQASGFSDKEGMIKALTKLKDTATEAPNDWGRALDMGTDINNQISAAMHGEKPDRNLARVLEQAKQSHQQALDEAGAKFGDAYRQAKQAWIDNVVPWEDPKQGGRLLKQFINSPSPDQAMSALLKAKSEDKIDVFLSKLSKDKGLPALQAGFVDDVMKQAMNQEGTKIIPEKLLGAIKQRQDAYGMAFTGEAKWRMDGLRTLVRDAKFTAQFLTGEWIRHIPGGRILPGSAYATPGAGSVLQKLFTSPLGQKLLVEASSLKPGSQALENLIAKDMPKIIRLNAGPSTLPTLPAAAQGDNPDPLNTAYQLDQQ